MKGQIETTNANLHTASFLRRGVLKLLLAAFAVLGSFGAPTQARAQTVDPGTGLLPPEPPEVVLRGYRPPPLKPTKITDLTPLFTTKNGTRVTLKARFWYLDKNNKWQPMSYKSVPLQFRVGSHWLGSSNTDRNGWASVTFQIRDPRLSARGKRINWRVQYAGDSELRKSPTAYGSFLLMP